MDIFNLKNVTYSYPEHQEHALDDLSLNIKKGSFSIICGPSGCGKSTLLKHLKTVISPHGELSGEILFEGRPLNETDERTQAREIGFVLQNPENQVVTDKVWHELAFGPESLGMETGEIRKKVAETASFFGIENWFYKNVNELSGGQKQLLSLASVMTMQPSVLVLDEPTSQLDPIAASDFLAVLGKINRELGITVILTEHRLEEAFPYATDIFVMNKGKLIAEGTPEEVGKELRSQNNSMFLAFPTAMRVWAQTDSSLPCPVTVRDGKDFLSSLDKIKPLKPLKEKELPETGPETVLECDNVWFSYEKGGSDILKGLDFSLKQGEFYTLLGGNGTGKSTALKILSGLKKPYRGTVRSGGKIALLPQNPQTLFVKKTVREDLYEIFAGTKTDKAVQDEKVSYAVSICGIKDILDRHPYDISGGEQQRAALAKVLLTEPQILLLDEPTKGFDAEFKIKFAKILYKLLSEGISILAVSHDVVFCAEYSFRCGLFFDGKIITENDPVKFFSGNNFYTTPANRMARHLVPEAVTVSDIIECTGGTPEPRPALHIKKEPLPAPAVTSADYIPPPLPLWRKITAGICSVAAIIVFFLAVGQTDLSSIVTANGLTSLADEQIFLLAAMTVSLLGLILSISRRSPYNYKKRPPDEKKKLNKRTKAAALMIILFIPLTIFAGVYYFDSYHYNIVALAVLFECMLPFLLIFEGRKPKPRELTVIAVLCAIGIAGRAAFFMLPQFKPVLALTIIAGVAFGGETGFFVGAVTMLTSNILFSQGPWTPWQMFAMGIIGFIAGILFRKGLLARTKTSLAVFGAITAVVIYGGIMNLSSILTVNPASLNGTTIKAALITGLPMDMIHAAATFIFLMLAAEPMLTKFDRIKTKYGLME